MRCKPLLCLLVLVATGPSFAGVIDRSCNAILGGRIEIAQSSVSAAAIPCDLRMNFSSRSPNPPPFLGASSYDADMYTSYTPAFTSSENGFSFELTHTGSAALSLTSGISCSGCSDYLTLGLTLREFGSADEFFSVDNPYTFELDYSFTNAESGTGSASGGARIAYSRNFLGDLSGGSTLEEPTSGGSLTGILVPGQVYHLRSTFDASLTGTARDGKTERFLATWSGSHARLTAVAVPAPGTALLFIGGLLLIQVLRFRRGMQ